MSDTQETTLPGIDLKPKTQLTGKVVKITLAGAIVDVGQAVPGIVHISQLQSEPVKRVEDVVAVGQEINTWVRKAKSDRIELTMIEPLGLEWRELKPETVVKGKVIRLETYGAFVEIGAERPGLVHISEMAHGYVKTPQEVVKEGDEIDVMVLEVDRKKKQIRLSMKATQPKPEEEVKEEPSPKADRSDRKRGPKKGARAQTEHFEMDKEPSVPELTAFELAWQAALDRSKAEKAAKSKKNNKSENKDKEDIFDRTLKNRLPTN
ncbi:MAG: S1 RNA-binding domain-containing protein [Anaerolineales bacterium]|jgi:ribosomal protein S1|nr:S1 RNA-binding domain-containing protein [Anaerolineales bacterium]